MSAATLPLDWDTASLFPNLESALFETACKDLSGRIEAFGEAVETAERGVGTAADLERVLRTQNDVLELNQLVNGFVHCLITTDSRNDAAQAASSENEQRLLPFQKLSTQSTAWIGTLDLAKIFAEGNAYVNEHEFVLRKFHEASQHLMSPAEESFASELEPSGSSAWKKLHGNVGSQLQVTVDLPSGPETVPISALRAMAYDPDREVRRAAYHAELDAWKQNEAPMAAAMNSIKGAVNVLSHRRGWKSPLEASLFRANIDQETLDAMLGAARESFPDFRRYLNAKARGLKLQKLAFFDIFSPLGGSDQAWDYESGAKFVADQFRTYSDKLGDFAERSFREAWVDVYPKPSKRDGAFCMGVRDGESRVLMNFKPSFGSVSTLAHELGHAYHNLCLAPRTRLQRRTPMTLAETASIFCETVIRQAALETGSDADKLTILEASLQGSCQVVVDITSRFLFEQGVFEKRLARELSAAEMCEIMLDAQRQTYGDGLDPEFLHPYMWAAKPHYYDQASYYNFPYMFGLLFGLGLYAIYKQAPSDFLQRYDDLLSSTGLADAATLGQRFGIDTRSSDFWRGSLNQIRQDIDRLEKLV